MRNSMMWFRQNVISTVPFSYPGAMRRVYPGFLQLTSFISMNLDRHIKRPHAPVRASRERRRRFGRRPSRLLRRISRGHGPHREFYLQTIQVVFKEHQLPRGVLGEPAAARSILPPSRPR